MKPDDLKALARKHIEDGQQWLVLTVPQKRRPRDRAALLPGLNGRVLATDGSRMTLMVDANAVLRWFNRRPLTADTEQPDNG